MTEPTRINEVTDSAISSTARIRHIPYAYSDGTGFGHHYCTQDHSLRTADQFDITIFPKGDSRRPKGDPMRRTPHIRIRVWDIPAREWREQSVTAIAAPDDYNSPDAP
jgi:hypothetical protein